jgi:uncharacterized protein
MKQKALIISGGIEAHEPEVVDERFKTILEKDGFEVTLSDILEVFADKRISKKLHN